MKLKAFSLVEVLVTILLLSLLISISMYSFKYFVNNLERTDLKTPKSAISYEMLSKSIEGSFYYEIDKKDPFGNIKKVYFNEALKKRYTYITTNPIYLKEISVASIVCKDKDLIYMEKRLYSNDNDFKHNPTILKPDYKKTIFEDIEGCIFSYNYNKRSLPSLVNLEYEKNKKQKKMIFYIFSDFEQHKSFLFEKRSDF